MDNLSRAFDRLSRSSRSLLYKFKDALEKQAVSLEFYCRKFILSKQWRIDKADLLKMIGKYKIYFTPVDGERLAAELIGPHAEVINFEDFQQILGAINQQHNPESLIRKDYAQICDLMHQSQNIMEILSVVSEENDNLLTESTLNEILKVVNYGNSEDKQTVIQNLLKGRESISIQHFMKEIELHEGRRAPIKQVSRIDNIRGNIQLVKPFFNSVSEPDERFLRLANRYLQEERTFKDEYSPTYDQAADAVHLALEGMSYCLFFRGQQQMVLCNQGASLVRVLLPRDVVQGSVKSCYFSSVMRALLCRFPELIFRLFVLFKNPAHIYGVRLFIDGKWETIVVDTSFFIDRSGSYCGVRSDGEKIWAMLLEKAFAKVNGSYEMIENGRAQEGFAVLTGATSYELRIGQMEVWSIMGRQYNAGSIVICSAENASQLGIVPDLAYSVMGMYFYKRGSDGKEVSLVKLRSPLEEVKWRGRWNSHCPLWTKQLKKQLDYTVWLRDGSFFMCEQDFTRCFSFVNVCRVQVGNVNSCLDLQTGNGEFVAARVKISKKGRYSFTAYLRQRRQMRELQVQDQRCSWMFMLCQSKQGFDLMCSNFVRGANGKVESEGQLSEGEYLIIARIKWARSNEEQYRLASYGPKQVQMQQIPFSGQWLEQSIKSACRSVAKVNRQGEREILRRMKFFPLLGYGFIEIVNASSQDLKVQIEFGEQQQNMAVLPPWDFPLTLSIKAGTSVVWGLVIPSQFSEERIEMKWEL